ncbi:hypothetical protein [Flagellimonas myxillae]|uniref:hypothetical protein n=1 Tax=Flagellimonas myxillae TaxID=2942214 RepID=UPI00201F9282|nr:hypothetical protein [Muricauda myxillae]MCL6267471.1 hypothetical protein [Muricauda myxillae]
MKVRCLFLFCFVGIFCFAQEFETYENGLIYSPFAMERLKGLVGEKNNEFRVCELNKTYHSLPQTKGRVFTIYSLNIKKLGQELRNGISLQEFASIYAKSEDLAPRLLVQREYETYNNEEVITIQEKPDGNKFEIAVSKFEASQSGKWFWDFSNEEYVDVVYVESPFSTQEIPEKYARMIQYSECLIDTTSQIFKPGAERDYWVVSDKGKRKNQNKLMDYIDERFGKERPSTAPDENLTTEEFVARMEKYEAWEKAKEEFVEQVLSKEDKFKALLDDAYREAKENKNSYDQIEFYVERFLSKGKALELKRNRIVVGQCSMDNSPRVHAMNIAQLAGEAVQWDIFLRAHLNVLNDNVSRVSDGSWAWKDRHTYIKELEELNIQVVDLIFGIAFRAQNVAEGHYFGNIGRLGRAVVESKDVAKFEAELTQAFSDGNLDDYNKMLMFYLYDHLIYNRDASPKKELYRDGRKKAIAKLPAYLQAPLAKI